MKKKIALLMATVMLFGVVVGGTLAWLTSTSKEVNNTFTNNARIEITLDEADVNIENTVDGKTTYAYTEYVSDNEKVDTLAKADRVYSNVYDILPGAVYFKDPTVHVMPTSDDCYVYVKVTETNNEISGKDIILYEIADIWKPTGIDNLYVLCENKDGVVVPHIATAGENPHILEYNKITINPDLTQTEISGLTITNDAGEITADNTPVLNFVAYAIQSANTGVTDIDSAAALWNTSFATN